MQNQGHRPQRDEIAAKLNVSEAKIKKVIHSVLDKTGFDSIAKFAVYAVGKGFVAPELL